MYINNIYYGDDIITNHKCKECEFCNINKEYCNKHQQKINPNEYPPWFCMRFDKTNLKIRKVLQYKLF